MQSLFTNAPNPAVVSLVISSVVMVLLTIGAVLARIKQYTAHKWVQTSAVLLNLGLVIAVMLQSFARAVAPGIPRKLSEAYYALAVGHGIIGLVAVLFGLFVVVRGHGLVPRALQFSNYKAFMRAAYVLYLGATLLGAWVFATWYGGATPETALAVAPNARELVVPMANFGFSPPELVVPQGATVVWVNHDHAPHNVVSDDGHTLRSELLANGQRFSATFDQIGTFPYYCELHGGAGGVDMAAVIRVVPAGDAPAVAAAPAATPAPPAQDTLAAAPALPAQARIFITHLLDDGPGLPARQGYAAGLQTQAKELARHAALLARAQAAADRAGQRRHAEHIYNLIAGSLDAQFGDLDGDGHTQNPGDGFGMLPNGTQAGYIQATIEAAAGAANAPDATDAIKLHAGHVRISAENIRGWAEDARTLALRLSRAANPTDTAHDIAQLVQLSQQIARGVDTNGDGEIAPIAGEGGALVAYEHARYMAGLGVSPAATP